MDATHTYSRLTSRLQSLRKKQARSKVFFGAGVTLTWGVGFVILALILEAWFFLPPIVKLSLWGIGSCATLAGLAFGCIRPLIRKGDLGHLASEVEVRYPGLKGGLVGTVELWPVRGSTPERYSPELIEAMVDHAGKASAGLDFEAILDPGPPRRAVRWLAGTCVALSILFVSDEIQEAAGRLRDAAEAFQKPAATAIFVSPGDAAVIQGEDFDLNIQITGHIPSTAEISFLEDGSEIWDGVRLPVGDGQVDYRFQKVKRSFVYLVRAHDGESPKFQLRTLERPTVLRMKMTYRYPGYTGLGERMEEDGTDIVAVKGTRVEMEILANKRLRSALVAFDDGRRLEAEVDNRNSTGRSARLNLTVTEDTHYTVQLLDTVGLSSVDQMGHRVIAIPDERPSVRITSPGHDVEVGEEMVLPLRIEARDDFGFSRMELLYSMNDEHSETVLPLPVGSGGELSVFHLWDLNEMNLLPDDRVIYRVRIHDNDRVEGPKPGETERFVAKLPSLADIAQQAELSQEAGIAAMEEVAELGKRVRERLAETRRSLIKGAGGEKGEMPWEMKKEVETAISKQVEMGERLKGISEKVGEIMKRLDRHGLIDMETLRKLEEIQKLTAEIVTPELKKAMRKLQEAAQSADTEMLQEALTSIVQNQDEFQKRLDRTIAMLKRVRQEQAFDVLVKRAEELVRAQEGVNQGLESGQRSPDLANRESGVKKETEGVRDAMRSLGQEILAEHPATADSLELLAADVDAERLPERMEVMTRSLLSEGPEGLEAEGASLLKSLKEIKNALQRARRSFLDRSKATIAAALERALHETISLSVRQEEVSKAVGELKGGTMRYDRMVQTQGNLLSGTTRLTDRVMEVGKRKFFVKSELRQALGASIGRMKEAVSFFEKRNGLGASVHGRKAMGSLNQAAILFRKALADLDASASATGFEEMIQQMQSLAERQSGVNEGTRQMLGAGGQGVQVDPRGALAQLAAEQEVIRQALEQLQSQEGRRGMLGSLDRIGDEMDRVLQDMQTRVTRRTLERQERILSRMLDATRSIRQRGFSEEHFSEVGRDYRYTGPSSLPEGLGQRSAPLREAMLRALKEGYPGEYRRLIRSYFEALARDQENQVDK